MQMVITSEENFKYFAIDDSDASRSEKFTVSEFNCEEESTLADNCKHIKNFVKHTEVKILHNALIFRDNEKRNERD